MHLSCVHVVFFQEGVRHVEAAGVCEGLELSHVELDAGCELPEAVFQDLTAAEEQKSCISIGGPGVQANRMTGLSDDPQRVLHASGGLAKGSCRCTRR